jgi:hypothetical protein
MQEATTLVRRHPILLIAAAAMLAAVMGWVFGFNEPLPVLRLSDGSLIRIERPVWDGQPFRLEPTLWTAVKTRLPKSLQRWTGAPRPAFQPSYRSGLTLAVTVLAAGPGASPIRITGTLSHRGPQGAEVGGISLGWREPPFRRFLHFYPVSWRDELLQFRLRDGTNWLDFSLPNPRRGEQLPE